jgi:hypothetical protein
MTPGTPPGLRTFPNGTVPDMPAPLQSASVQEGIINNAVKESPCPASPNLDIDVNPLPTPMSGTNHTLEGVAAPGIMVTSPSAPSMQEHNPPGYFDIVLPIENDYERTKTLDTESGFPTFDKAVTGAMETSNSEFDDAVLPGHATIPEVEPTSFDQSFSVPLMDDSLAFSAPRIPSGSSNHGENVVYILYDRLGPSDVGQSRKQCHGDLGSLTSQCSEKPRYNSMGYDRREATSSSHYWTDNTEAGSTDMTELTQYTSLEEAAAEAKLMAAIEELDAATLPARPQSPDNDKKALQDIIRTYGHLHEGTDDAKDGSSLAEGPHGITQELKDEVETSIRVMNRSLGG